MSNTLNLNISTPLWEELIPDIEEKSQSIFDMVINQINAKILADKNVSANLMLSDDTEVHRLNLDFRDIDKPTNILSFANIDDDEFKNYINHNENIELGDMIIAYETMAKESEEQNITLNSHYTHLLIHGILHLLGYDHILDKDADEMESLEIELLKTFNIENPYKEEN